jgi:WD40 repeat protein/serine/threonine protein kinase
VPIQAARAGDSDFETLDAFLHPAARSVETPLARVGPYRVVGELGHGGMGVVYLAEQERPIRRRVALKVIKLGMDTKEVVARFEAERQALALMDHPNIAKVYDAGATEDGRPFFVMEAVDGIPLTEYCDACRLGIEHRLRLFVQVCRGAQHAHSRGIIHRDLKPSNILVSCADGDPLAKVIDFGVAKATDRQLTEKTIYTQLGRAVGTPAYMSPEQALLSSEGVDGRTDVYSLGVILYELLVGRQPLEWELYDTAAYDEILRRIREEEPPSPSTRWMRLNHETTLALAGCRAGTPASLAGELRGELDWIAMRAMDKEKARRYATPAELALDIERYLRGEPVHARPPSTLYRARKFVYRYRRAVAAAVAVVLALAVALVVSILGWIGTQGALREARSRTYLANITAAAMHLEDLNVAEARRRLEDSPVELRGWEWSHLALKGDPAFREIQGHEMHSVHVAFSPDRRLLVTATKGRMSVRTSVDVWSVEPPARIAELAGHEGVAECAGFSRDGRRIASGGVDATVRLWDLGSRSLLQTFRGHEGTVLAVDVHPDGRIASGGADGTVRLWESGKEEPIAVLPDHGARGARVSCVLFDPAGARLASAADDRRVILWALDPPGREMELPWQEPKVRADLLEHEHVVPALAFRPDGLRLVACANDGQLRLWDTASGAALLIFRGHEHYIWSAAFTPDGARLVSGGKDRTVRVWDPETADLLVTLTGHEDHVTCVAVTPDGGEILSRETLGNVRRWDIATLGAVTVLRAAAPPLKVFFDPHGARVMSLSAGGALESWGASTGVRVETRGKGSGRVFLAASAEGDRLAYKEGSSRLGVEGPSGVTVLGPLPGGGAAAERAEILCAAFASDGTRLAAGGRKGRAAVWDLAEGGLQAVLPADPENRVLAVAFRPDGKLLATGSSDDHVRVFDAASGALVATLAGHGGDVFGVAWSPDGERLASASQDRKAMVWDLARGGTLAATVTGHGGKVYTAVFNPDGTRLITASQDGFARLSHARTGDLFLTLKGHAGEVYSAAFSPDGKRVVTGSEDGTVRVWESRLSTAREMWRGVAAAGAAEGR